MKHTFEITKKIEVTFPHYRNYAFFYYKVLDEKREIKVQYINDDWSKSAVIGYDSIVPQNTFGNQTEEITAEEFNEVFANALVLIQSKNV
jgi:hypothetical protein